MYVCTCNFSVCWKHEHMYMNHTAHGCDCDYDRDCADTSLPSQTTVLPPKRKPKKPNRVGRPKKD